MAAVAATLPGSEMTEHSANEEFFNYFQHEVTALQEQIARLEDHGTSGGERADAVDHCLAGIARLSNEVKDTSSYIPAYDQRTYSDAIKALSTKLQNVRTKVAPRQKFSFKSSAFTARKNASAISLNDAAELTNQRQRQITGYVSDASGESSSTTTPAGLHSPAPERLDEGDKHAAIATASDLADATHIPMPSFSQSTSMSINNHESQHVILPPSTSHGTGSRILSDLRSCVVDLYSPTSKETSVAGIALKNINDSLIICGQVNGAAHLTNISNSVIVVACRQFRMHESQKCDVYLHALSRPIIEDCSGVRFAPLPETFGSREYQATENQWQTVDDFKWLKSEPSPNWSVLEQSGRIPEKVWKEIVPGGPGIGTIDILKAVQVSR